MGERNIVHFVPTTNHSEILEIYRQLAIASFERHTGSLSITIHNNHYMWSYDQWIAVLEALDQWYDDFIASIEETTFY
jgi:hypothetical protein